MNSWVRKIPWKRDRLPTPVFLGFPGGSDGKESTCNVSDLGSVSGLGRSPGGRAWQPTPVFLPGDSRWTEELDGLQFMVSQRVDMSDRLSTAQLSSLPPWTQTHTPTMVFSPVVLILFPGLLDSLMPIVLSRALMSCTHYLPQAPPLPCTLSH